MIIYYKEDDIYPGMDNFKDETTGTCGTDIDFLDVANHAGTNCSICIISSFGGHSKVLKLTDATATDYNLYTHTIGSTEANATMEFWWAVSQIASSDGAKVVFFESGTEICGLYINTDDLRTYNPAATAIKSDFLVANTWFHIKIILDDTNNQFDCYINGVNEGTFAYRNNSTTGIDSIQFGSGFDDIINIYWDAFGYSWDTNYNIGDNRTDDYHYYNRTQLTDIISYPIITTRNNMYGLCSIKVRDFEGALYDTWYDKDFTEFVIEDNATDENKIFRGYLINKKFRTKELELYLAGIGVKLDWAPFYRDYILEEGKVRAPINASSVIDCYNDDSGDGVDDGAADDFAWVVDGWHADQSVGLLLTDTTKTIDSETWTCTAISTTNGTNTGGNAASLNTPDDLNSYDVTETGTHWDCFITPTIGGANIATTKILDHITVNYKIRYKQLTPVGQLVHYYLQMKNSDGDWINVLDKYVRAGYTVFLELKDSFTLPISGTENLAKFLVVDGANWDECVELRFKMLYQGLNSMTGYIELDYLTVDVYYEAYAFAPIMEPITDNAASTLTCAGIADWTATGVSVDDDFKIGQNTVQIIDDIAAESGSAITIIGQEVTGGGTQILRPDGDSSVAWSHTDSGGDGSHWKDLDEVIEDPNAGDGNVIYSTTHNQTDIFTMGTVAMGGANVVTEIELYVYARYNTIFDKVYAYFYTTSTGWSEARLLYNLTDSYVWKTVTWENMALSQADLDSLLIKFVYYDPSGFGQYAYIDLFYVDITYGIYNPFTKFIARKFRGTHCIDGMKAICELEGALWCEDYVNNRIKVLEPSNFETSDISLTSEDYDFDWEFEDQCNQVRRVDVFGSVDNADYPIHEYAVDNNIAGFRSVQINNARIMTAGDAKEIADSQINILKNKRPSLKLTLQGTYPQIQMGTTVNVTLARPTVAAADYPIRMIERSMLGNGDIKTVIYCGLGETEADEEIGMTIRKIGLLANRAMSDRLI